MFYFSQRGLYLTDLIAIDEGNPTFSGDKDKSTVNYTKFNLIATIFEHIVRFQGSHYSFQERLDIKAYLERGDFNESFGFPYFSSPEDEERILYERSLGLESKASSIQHHQ